MEITTPYMEAQTSRLNQTTSLQEAASILFSVVSYSTLPNEMNTHFGRTTKHIGKLNANNQGFVKMTTRPGKLNAPVESRFHVPVN